MAENTHQAFGINADSIYLNNRNDKLTSHIDIETNGVLGENNIVLKNCNVDMTSGGFVKAPDLRTTIIKDTDGNSALTLSGGHTIDFNTANIDFNSATVTNMFAIPSTNGYASLDAELDSLHTNKVSITGHTASRVLVTSSGGGLTTSARTTTDLGKLEHISVSQAVNLDDMETDIGTSVQENTIPSNTVILGGGADKTSNYDFKLVATALNISPDLWRYLTLRTPTLGSDIIVTLPSAAGTLQLVPSEGAFANGDKTKLDAIEASADVTDATNVTAAGALMDSEMSDLAGVKGVTISTLQVKPSEGAFANGDKTKLDAIEASADVTDATNVTAAGALMDSEMSDLAGVKGVTISTLQVKPSEGAFANGDKTKLDANTAKVTFDGTASTKVGHLTVTQAVNLDTIEGDVASLLLHRVSAAGSTTLGLDWYVSNAYFGCYNYYSSPSYVYFMLVNQIGSLPGYSSNYYPTLKTDYANLYFSADGEYSAYIDGDGGAGLLDFTGQHQALPVDEDLFNNIDDYIGRIVISNGYISSIVKDASGSYIIETGKKGITINEAIPKVVLCNQYKDKRVFGVISPEVEREQVKNMANRQNEKHFKQGAFVSVITGLPSEDNRIIINSVGEGAVWVSNDQGNIENGDFICSSGIGEGYGCLQDDDLLHNYTIAKATISCDFDLESVDYECEEFTANNITYKKAFISCCYKN